MNVNLTTPEAKNWQENGTNIQVLDKQPPEDINIFLFKDVSPIDKKLYAYFVNKQNDDSCCIKLPLSVGDIIGCRETWAICSFQPTTTNYFVYKADYTEKQLEFMFVTWHSPVTMPHEAIRKWIEIVSIECKRVQDVTMPEMCAIFDMPYSPSLEEYTETKIATECEFIDWFNSTHAKPRPVKEHGKVVSYKCYPYSFDSAIQNDYIANIYSTVNDKGLYYKGLPLESIVNPVVVLGKYRKAERL